MSDYAARSLALPNFLWLLLRRRATLQGQCKRLYVIGGQKADKRPLKSVEIYVPAENRWFQGSDMLEARTAHSACVLPG